MKQGPPSLQDMLVRRVYTTAWARARDAGFVIMRVPEIPPVTYTDTAGRVVTNARLLPYATHVDEIRHRVPEFPRRYHGRMIKPDNTPATPRELRDIGIDSKMQRMMAAWYFVVVRPMRRRWAHAATEQKAHWPSGSESDDDRVRPRVRRQ